MTVHPEYDNFTVGCFRLKKNNNDQKHSCGLGRYHNRMIAWKAF